jgi:hypothetical protein
MLTVVADGRKAAIRKMKALKESVSNDLDLLESPAGF